MSIDEVAALVQLEFADSFPGVEQCEAEEKVHGFQCYCVVVMAELLADTISRCSLCFEVHDIHCVVVDEPIHGCLIIQG